MHLLALCVLVAGAVVMLAVRPLQLASWQSCVLIGSVVTLIAGALSSRSAGEGAAPRP